MSRARAAAAALFGVCRGKNSLRPSCWILAYQSFVYRFDSYAVHVQNQRLTQVTLRTEKKRFAVVLPFLQSKKRYARRSESYRAVPLFALPAKPKPDQPPEHPKTSTQS